MNYTIKKEYGANWLLIFHHDISTGQLFDEEKIRNAHDRYLYSIIYNVSGKYKENGYFEYLLEYPEVEGYNRWLQKIDIASTDKTQTSADIGYKGIHISFNGNHWGGISRSNSELCTIFDGSPGIGTIDNNYWYSIGAIRYYFDTFTFPGVLIEGDIRKGIQECFLWIRIYDHYKCSYGKLTKFNITNLILITIISS